MPSKVDPLRVPRVKGIDKRIKLSDADRAAIIESHGSGASINGLAREYGVNKRLIQFILFPERQRKNLQDRQERGGSAKYYDVDKHREAMREHRSHKRKLLKDGVITP